MSNSLNIFRTIVDRVSEYNEYNGSTNSEDVHPFDARNIHPEITKSSLKLFNDGHYSQATFEAYKFVDKLVSKTAGSRSSGYKLMMDVFNENAPKIKLNKLASTSEIDEQMGYKFIFAGAASGIRNPRGHEVNLPDSVDTCLDHLSLASLLLRALDKKVS